ncbi:MAG: transaldolase family protein [Rubrivivax sp.]
MNQLDALQRHSVVATDARDCLEPAICAPRDATTHRALILKAIQQPDCSPLWDQAVAAHRGEPLDAVVDALLVRFGGEIVKAAPGRVSTELDARLAFDAAASVARARHLITLYERHGIERERVLIQLASTWEGIQAAHALEREGIHCTLTLLFAFCQAVACGDAGVTRVSPSVGRIDDGSRQAVGSDGDAPAKPGSNDPGVRTVTRIWRYYKHFEIATEVNAADFRHTGQIQALAGCDLLTISPELLAELQAAPGPVPRVLDPVEARATDDVHAVSVNEAGFRWAMNEDAMATEKLAEGIRDLAADAVTLDRLIEAGRA